jgi:ABC-type multidrug transport system fused ATPase/permease subunit
MPKFVLSLADCPFRMHSTIRAASDATVFRAGLATMIVMIPLNTWIAKKQAELNRAIMKIKDERSNVMDEVLQGIRIIKYFAWERSFKKKVSEVREREVSLIWKNALWGVASMFLWGGSPMLVALITFIVYSASGNDLKPSIAFTGLALFNVLRFPLNTLPMIINLIVESQVALGRIRDYLLADEIDRSYYENRDDAANDEDGISMSRGPKAGDLAIAIQEGRFSWAQPRDEQAVERQKQREAEEKKRWAIVRLFSRAETSKLLLEKEMAGYNVVLRDIDLGLPPNLVEFASVSRRTHHWS